MDIFANVITSLPPGKYRLGEPIYYKDILSVQNIRGLKSKLSLAFKRKPFLLKIEPQREEWPKCAILNEGTDAFNRLDEFMNRLRSEVGVDTPAVERYHGGGCIRIKILQKTHIFVFDARTHHLTTYDATIHPALRDAINCVPCIAPPRLWRRDPRPDWTHHRGQTSGWVLNVNSLVIVINGPTDATPIKQSFAPEIECVVCMDRAPDVKFDSSCGHVCCCRGCAATIDRCPLCRGPFTKYTVVVADPTTV